MPSPDYADARRLCHSFGLVFAHSSLRSCDGYNFIHQGATIVDALDTLYLMGLTQEFEEALQWVVKSLRSVSRAVD